MRRRSECKWGNGEMLDNQRKWQWTDGGGGGGGGVRSNAKPDIFSIPLDPTKEDPTFPKQDIAEDFWRYGGTKDTGLKHEAGFDAYMTGAVFAQVCHLLQIDVATIRNLPQAVKQGDAALASYANLLALGWVGIMALDLSSGKQATGVKAFHAHQLPANHHSDNSTVALVWGFPAGSREQDLLIQKWFRKCSSQKDMGCIWKSLWWTTVQLLLSSGTLQSCSSFSSYFKFQKLHT